MRPPRTLAQLAALASDGAEALQPSGEPVTQWESALAYAAPTPDQLRVAALPQVATLVTEAHEAALPALAQSAGAAALRNYLREMQKGPFASYAKWKLPEFDRIILASYNGQASQALRNHRFEDAKNWYRRIISEYTGTTDADVATVNLRGATINGYNWAATQAVAANNFDEAKRWYRQIVAEYPDSSEAAAASGELTRLVPVAVGYYKKQGDTYFQPDTQWGVPQTKAREYFQKMYNEDPDGPQADYALFNLAQALGTESKATQAMEILKTLLAKFPDSQYRRQGMYFMGFLYGGQNVNDPENAIKWMSQVVQKYPGTLEASESLWHMAFYCAWTKVHRQIFVHRTRLRLASGPTHWPINSFYRSTDDLG